MNSPDPRQPIRDLLVRCGAHAVGFAAVQPVDSADTRILDRWIDRGFCADMAFMQRYADIRHDPALLLNGARTLIVALFNYHHSCRRWEGPLIAEYARGEDYHLALRRRLELAATQIREGWGGDTRVCIDSAPLRERYWAVRAGLGVCGRNGQLTRPGEGAAFLIATILWTGTLTPDSPLNVDICADCRRCVDACPAKALDGSGAVDARRCISYLTIEERNPVAPDANLAGSIFGCDICRRVCPHSAKAPLSNIPELAPDPRRADMTLHNWLELSLSQYRHLCQGTAMSRTPLRHIQSSAANILAGLNRPK